MKTFVFNVGSGLCLLIVALVVGCRSKSDTSTAPNTVATQSKSEAGESKIETAQPSQESTTTAATTKKPDSDNPAVTESVKPFRLGDLLQPFVPPPLAELDKTAGWTDQPVRSGMEVMRKKQEAQGPPPVSVRGALALRNDSPENNSKIRSALSRIAPADGTGVDYDATFVRHAGGDMKSSNPLLMSTTTEMEFQELTSIGQGNTLIVYDEDLSYFAPKEVVVSWQTSKDHMLDKFVLRDDMTWSDGKPITAHDVEFSFKVIMSEAVPVLAVRTGTDQNKWVKAYDDHTLVVFHKEALATNTINMAFPIIPKHVYENSLADDPTMARSEYHTRLEDKPVVSGPYELIQRVRTQEFVVRRREGYYMHNGKQVRPKPYFREVRVKTIEDLNTALLAVKAGQIDEMELRAEHWTSQTNDDEFYKRNTKIRGTEWSEFHFDWNTQSVFFSDKRVRKAMSSAFDYDEFLNKITYGLYEPCRGDFHPTHWAFPKDGPQPYHQDLDKAEDLLDQAGWTDSDGDGIRDKEIDGRRVPFKFTLLTYQTENGVQCATLMKECLAKIGIICNVKPTEFTVLTDSQQHHKFDAAMGGWQSGSDPDANSNVWLTGESRNYGSYSNKQVDKLFDKGRREFDRDKRAAIYGQIHNILWDDQPYTWLFYRPSLFAFNKKMRAYNLSPTGPFLFSPGFDSWYKAVATP